jgi:DNA-binding transcriptional MocR family regulator
VANINFLRGVPADVALVPVAEALAKAYAEILQTYGGKVIQYQSPGLTDFLGFNGLKETLGNRFGAPGDPLKQVVCTNGGMETFSMLLKSLKRGSKVATDAITYDRVLLDIERLEHVAVGVPLGDDGIDLDELDKTLSAGGIDIYYQVGYHHNPMGLTVSTANMDAAAEICAKHGVLYVLDIAYFELRYDGRKNEMINLSRFPETSSIVGSFTKTLSPGAKCGFGIFPESVVTRLTPVIGNTRLNPNYPTQAAINRLFETGFYDKHLEYLNELYAPRMAAANTAMQKHLPDIDVPTLTGGFFVGIWMKGIRDESAFAAAVKEHGATISASHVFAPGIKEEYMQKLNAAFFRLTFPAYTPEENEAGIKAIADAYDAMK